ncbi:hypothetical protein [Glycomyces xiaoerkulensis]|uniref:hypothetical protein n=1 Tax=Glycomyces xiaoerkulensis TaxID=2038139 RepID=UPI000C25DAA9|nr:hypothetical protein [Glycomyces xiaoerkulensis]
METGETRRLPLAEWPPVEACTLPTEERPLRAAEFNDLLGEAADDVERVDPTLLRMSLEPTPATAARIAELATRETDCCGFFTFVLTAADQRLTLEVTVPPEQAAVLDGLEALTAAAR